MYGSLPAAYSECIRLFSGARVLRSGSLADLSVVTVWASAVDTCSYAKRLWFHLPMNTCTRHAYVGQISGPDAMTILCGRRRLPPRWTAARKARALQRGAARAGKGVAALLGVLFASTHAWRLLLSSLIFLHRLDLVYMWGTRGDGGIPAGVRHPAAAADFTTHQQAAHCVTATLPHALLRAAALLMLLALAAARAPEALVMTV